MQYGFGAPVSGPLSGAKDLARIAQQGEAAGYDYCTLSDHVVIPRELENKYPYSDTGEFPGGADGKNPLDDRQSFRGPADPRHWRRLVPRGVRGHRHRPV